MEIDFITQIQNINPKSDTRHDKIDYDEILYINNVEQSAAWLAKLRECRPKLPAWVSDFHPRNCPVNESDEYDRSGSYNWIGQFICTGWSLKSLKASNPIRARSSYC